MGLAPLFDVTAHGAGAASPEIRYASVDFSTIDSRTPSIAPVGLLGVGSPASEFHRTAFGGVRGVVNGVELPAPANSSTIVRSVAWSGSTGVAVGSTIDSDGVVRSALWRTTGRGWKLVIHRFLNLCLRCVEVRSEFQFVVYSAGLVGFAVASSGGMLSLLLTNDLEPLDTTKPALDQTTQCEVNNVAEDLQALWVLGSCAPEFRFRRYPTVTRTGFRDRKTIEITAFGSYEPLEFGISRIGSSIFAFEAEPERSPSSYQYRKVDPSDVAQRKPWSQLTPVLSASQAAPLLRVHMFRVDARRRSDRSWPDDHFDLLINEVLREPLSFVRRDDVMHDAPPTSVSIRRLENGQEQTTIFRGQHIVVRDLQYGTQILVDNTIENETWSEFDNDQQTLTANREMAAVVVSGGESSVGSWSGWRTVGITTNGTTWTWRDEKASTTTAATCVHHQTLGIVSPNLFTIIDARNPDQWNSWVHDDVLFTACGFAGSLRLVAGYQEKNGLAFPIVFLAREARSSYRYAWLPPECPRKCSSDQGGSA